MKPKVSILIPTYNRPHYLQQALESAINQSYPHIEIIICDNSDNAQTEQIVKGYMYKHPSKIRYVRNNPAIGALQNQHKCLELAQGEYINYLMDDDLLHPAKLEKMVPYLMKDQTIKLVTSQKKIIDGNAGIIKLSKLLEDRVSILDGIELGNWILEKSSNVIGEPTCVLFRKKDLQEPFGSFCGKQSENCVDIATWLHLMAGGKAVYIPEPLSSFRCHSTQLTHTIHSKMRSAGDWIQFVLDARKAGYLLQDDAYFRSMKKVNKRIIRRLTPWQEKAENPLLVKLDPYTPKLERRLKLFIKAMVKHSRFKHDVKNMQSLLAEIRKSKKLY